MSAVEQRYDFVDSDAVVDDDDYDIQDAEVFQTPPFVSFRRGGEEDSIPNKKIKLSG